MTSTLFLTGLAPNLLAKELVKKTANVDLAWDAWFAAAAPAGLLLLVSVPLLAYWLYPPEVKEGTEVTEWAAKELAKLGGFNFSRNHSGRACRYSVGPVDFRRRLREPDHRRTGGDLSDGQAQRYDLG